MPFMQRTYEEIKTNNTVCFTYYQWGLGGSHYCVTNRPHYK